VGWPGGPVVHAWSMVLSVAFCDPFCLRQKAKTTFGPGSAACMRILPKPYAYYGGPVSESHSREADIKSQSGMLYCCPIRDTDNKWRSSPWHGWTRNVLVGCSRERERCPCRLEGLVLLPESENGAFTYQFRKHKKSSVFHSCCACPQYLLLNMHVYVLLIVSVWYSFFSHKGGLATDSKPHATCCIYRK